MDCCFFVCRKSCKQSERGNRTMSSYIHFTEEEKEQARNTVPKLMKMTGLSRGFFYKNPTIRKEMDDAVQSQAGLIDPRRAIIDRAMEGHLELLEQQVRELQRENEKLKKRNAKLQRAVDRKDLNFIKNL